MRPDSLFDGLSLAKAREFWGMARNLWDQLDQLAAA